jgi:hypothetical protein
MQQLKIMQLENDLSTSEAKVTELQNALVELYDANEVRIRSFNLFYFSKTMMKKPS